ncbi:MAG: hypothetical protein H6711_05025 [Myxococcales bacterium]|nr:hypothetical protein [Myxococcales bacterium]
MLGGSAVFARRRRIAGVGPRSWLWPGPLGGHAGLAGPAVALLGALAASAAITGLALLSGARERRARLARTRPAAAALAEALGLPPPRPCEEPWREGLWQIDGVVEGRLLRLLVGPSGVELSFAVAGAEGLDLARDEDFGRGGIASPPEDPYQRLPVEVAGPGWWVRGVDGPRRALALPGPLGEALREGRVALVDGRLTAFFAASDADAAAIRALVQRLVP